MKAAATEPLSAPSAARVWLLFAAALLVRAVYFLAIRRTACLDINLDPISDMETFHRWALTIVNGDWLGRGDFHPFHPWQAAVAAPEQWALWYGHVFHQEPLYPYLVALVYLVAPRDPSSVIVLQLILGAAGCVFTYLAARRLIPEGAALAAGVLSVLYGPYLYYESLLLRDSFLIPLDAFLLWILLEARARLGRRGAAGWWAGAGAALGLVYLTKANILPFAAILLVWTLAERGGPPRRQRATAAAALCAAFVAVLAPVVARNLAVGAPWLKITTRGPIEFINGNNRWHAGIGWFDGSDRRVSDYARATLARADGALLPTIVTVVGDWSGDLPGLARLQLAKAGYFFAPFEMPNNASYSWFRLNSTLLHRFTLSFLWISPLALVGLLASWPERRRFAPVYLFLASGIGITIVFYVIARFRAPFMPAILILAALGLWTMRDLFRRGRWAALAGALALAGCALSVNAATDLPDEKLVRPQDCHIAIRGYLARGMEGEALATAEIGRRLFPGFAEFHKAAALIYLRQGRRPEAARAFTEALARDPSDAEARRELSRLGPPP